MDKLPFLLQLGVIAGAVALLAAWAINWVWQARRAGAAPLIEASFKELQAGWYQLDIVIANRAPYGVVVGELRRVKPRAARLMAPVKRVSTREGDFQVWAHPSTDKASASIPLALALGPQEVQRGGIQHASEGHIAVWLFFTGGGDRAVVVLELSLRDRAGHLRRYRFSARRATLGTVRLP